MSILSVGSRCAICATVDFLPSTCQTCLQLFCGVHLLSHPCASQSNPTQLGGPSSFRLKSVCEREGCDRPRIEAIAGIEVDSEESSGSGDVKIAKQVRCHACGGAFCTMYLSYSHSYHPKHQRRDQAHVASRHRAQTNHGCSAPLDFTARQDAAILRKARAQDVLARTMPAHQGKVIAKPPPGRDVERIRPTPIPKLSQPSSNADAAAMMAASAPEEEKSMAKSRAEKLYETHLRKVRSLAKPLNSRQKGEGERRFFEWAVDERGEGFEKWEKDGKWDGKTERVWIMSVTCLHLQSRLLNDGY